MTKLVLYILTHIILVNGMWNSLIPPLTSPTRGALIGTYSRCAEDMDICEVIFAWSGGDILAVDMQTHNIKSYHSAVNPTGISGNISAVAISPQSNYIFVTTTNSSTVTSTPLYYMNLDYAGLPNAWNIYNLTSISTSIGYPSFIIPLDSTQSSQILLFFTDGTAAVVDPFFNTSSQTILHWFHSGFTSDMPKNCIITDITTGDYPNLSRRELLMVTYAGGSSHWDFLDSIFHPSSFSQGQIDLPALPLDVSLISVESLIYRINGTSWFITAQNIMSPTPYGIPLAGSLIISDLIAFTIPFQIQSSPTAMTILSDLELIDWLVVAQGDGAIMKYNLATIGNNPQPFIILPSDPLYSASNILSLHSNWMLVDGVNGTQILPVLIVVSKSGKITILPSGSSKWQTILSPNDLKDPSAKIVDVHFVRLSIDDFIIPGIPAYKLQVVLDDGHVLVQEDTKVMFTSGSPTLTDQRYTVRQYDYLNGITSRQLKDQNYVQTGTLSFNQICSLIQMNAEIHVHLLSASTQQTLQLRIVGYETNSDPLKQNLQNVILIPQVNDSLSRGIGLSFWTNQEISQEFEVLFNYIDAGLGIVDFVWTGTYLFRENN